MRNVIFAALLLFLGVGCVQPSSVALESIPLSALEIEFQNGRIITVDIADTSAKWRQGLSGRPGLEEYQGLLFVYPSAQVQTFWMKDMLFPIDIIWLNQGRVVGFVQSAQPEDPPTTLYASPTAVDKVLEVSAGFVVANNVKIGDILDIRLSDR